MCRSLACYIHECNLGNDNNYIRILWLRCYINNYLTGSVGESHAICKVISDIISNARNQLYEYTAATVHFFSFIDRLLLICCFENDLRILKLIM